MNTNILYQRFQGIKKYFFNTFWLLADQGQKLIFSFVVGIFVVRYLGPAEYGKFSFATGFVGLFAAISQMGLASIVVRDIVKKRFELNQIMGAAWALQFFGGLMTFALASLSSFFLGSSDTVKYLVVIISSAEAIKSFSVIQLYFEAKIRTKNLAKVSLFQSIVTTSIKAALIIFQADVLWFGVVVLIDTILAAIGLVFIYRWEGRKIFDWKIKKTVLIKILKDSWPLVFYGMAINVQGKIDQVMLGNMVGEEVVGQYSIAMRICGIVVMIPFMVQKSLAPSIADAKTKGELIYRPRLLNLYRLFFLMFLVFGGSTFLVSETLVVMIYGTEFQEAGMLLSLFAIKMLFNFMGIAKSVFITNEDLFKHGMLAAIVSAIVNVSANFFLIPLYESKGAILATIISHTCFVFIIDLINPKARNNLGLMVNGMLTFFKLQKI